MTLTGKGLLLAASTRDDELTALAGTRAAHRLPVANQPLLTYGLAAMQASGVEDVAVIVSPGTSAEVRTLLSAATDGPLRIGCIDAGETKGLVHALRAASHFLDERPVMVHLGDALVSQPLPRLFEELAESGADALMLVRNAAELGHLGPMAGARPLRLVQDKPVPPDEQALAGVFVLGPAAIDAALALPDDAGVAEIIGAIGEAGRRLETRIVNGSWKYTGEVDGLLAANRMVLDQIESELAGCDLSQARIEGRVQIHPTAIIERSTIRGPAVIGPRAVLQDAFVGPYSAVGAEVRLEGAELEHSIVLDHAVIQAHRPPSRGQPGRKWRHRDARLRFPLRPAAARRPPGRGTARLRAPHAESPPVPPKAVWDQIRARPDRAPELIALAASERFAPSARELGRRARGQATRRRRAPGGEASCPHLPAGGRDGRAGGGVGNHPGRRRARLAPEPDGVPRGGLVRVRPAAIRCARPSCSRSPASTRRRRRRAKPSTASAATSRWRTARASSAARRERSRAG